MRKVLVTIVVLAFAFGIVLLVRNYDEIHWWLARKCDTPDIYAEHARRHCTHAETARAREHELLWTGMQSGDMAAVYLYLRDFFDGPHIQFARERCDDEQWERCKQSTTSVAVLGSLTANPNSIHAAEMQKLYDDLHWKEMRESGDEYAMKALLEKEPAGPRAEELKVLIDDARFRHAAFSINAIEELDRYLREMPDGRHAEDARQKLLELGRDTLQAALTTKEARLSGQLTTEVQIVLRRCPDSPQSTAVRARLSEQLWADALRSESVEDYRVALATFPTGPHAAEARAIVEGTELTTLIERGDVKLETVGAGISNVDLTITWLHAGDPVKDDAEHVVDGVTVRVPAGTYFLSGNENTQNMLSYRDYCVRLHDRAPTARARPETACANHDLAIPKPGVGMAQAVVPPSPELARAARAIDAAKATYAVAQAAIWIVSDDSNLAGLGTLVLRSSLVDQGGTPVISRRDMAQAIEILAGAGIDVESRAIWRDRMQFREFASPAFRPRYGAPATLEDAARFGTLEEFAALWTEAPDVRSLAAMYAIQRGEPFVRMMAARKQDLDELLFVAIRGAEARFEPLLLDLGANVSAVDEAGESALELAAEFNRVEAVKTLLDRGALIEGASRHTTPLGHAARAGALDAVRLLLERGAAVNGGDTPPLVAACGSYHREIVALLLDHGADVNQSSRGEEPTTALGAACTFDFGTADIVELLIRHGADLTRGTDTRSPLQIAVENRNERAALALLDAGVDPDARPKGTPTPAELCREVIDRGEDPFDPLGVEQATRLLERLEKNKK